MIALKVLCIVLKDFMNVEPDLGCGYQQRFFNGKQMMLELNSEGWVETDQGDRV